MGGRRHFSALRDRIGARSPASRVTTTELFFDLVFVFVITQLTDKVAHDPTPAGLGQALLVLVATFWMYGGYAWLTNAVPPHTPIARGLLLLAMVGFLVMALATPHAFGDDGTTYALAFLFVVVIHAGLYVTSSETGNVRAILRIAPVNVLGGLLLLAAGELSGSGHAGGSVVLLWLAAIALFGATPFVGITGFTVQPGHFVERHGLVVIIALGESVVAIGATAAGLPLTGHLVLACALTLVLAVVLWWAYFDSDDGLAEEAMDAAAPAERPLLALLAFGFAFVPILFGIVLVAAGLETALGHLGQVSPGHSAWLLGGGVASFFVGDVAFRAVLGIRPVGTRALAVAGSLALVPLGLVVAGAVQVAALAGLVAALLGYEAQVARTPVDGVPDPGPDVRQADAPASVDPAAGA